MPTRGLRMGGVDHDGYATCSRRGHSIRYFVLASSTRRSTELTAENGREAREGALAVFILFCLNLAGKHNATAKASAKMATPSQKQKSC